MEFDPERINRELKRDQRKQELIQHERWNLKEKRAQAKWHFEEAVRKIEEDESEDFEDFHRWARENKRGF